MNQIVKLHFLSRNVIGLSVCALLCLSSFGCSDIDSAEPNITSEAKRLHSADSLKANMTDPNASITAMFTVLDTQNEMSSEERRNALTTCGVQPTVSPQRRAELEATPVPISAPLFREVDEGERVELQSYFERESITVELPQTYSEALAHQSPDSAPSALEIAFDRLPTGARARVELACQTSDISNCASAIYLAGKEGSLAVNIEVR